MDKLVQLGIMKFNHASETELNDFMERENIDFTGQNPAVQTKLQSKYKVIEDKLKNTNLSESEQAALRQQMALVAISSGNRAEYVKLFEKIGQKSITPDLLCALHIAALRAAISMSDYEFFQEQLQKAQAIKNVSFDNSSQIEIYEAVGRLLFVVVKGVQLTHQQMMANIVLITQALTNNISTFSADDLMPFRDFVVVAFCVAICKLNRKELQLLIEKQMDSYPLVLSEPCCNALLKVANDCEYERLQEAQNILIDYCNKNFFLHNYAGVLSDLFKVKIYDQFLKTYNAVQLEQASKHLGVPKNDLVPQLEYFIFSGQLKAKMTEQLLVRVEEDKCTESFWRFYDSTSKLLNKIEVLQRSK